MCFGVVLIGVCVFPVSVQILDLLIFVVLVWCYWLVSGVLWWVFVMFELIYEAVELFEV